MSTTIEPTTAAPAPVHPDPVANAVLQLTAIRTATRARAAEELIARWRAARTDNGTEQLHAFHAEAEAAIREADDPQAAFQEILDLIKAERARQRAEAAGKAALGAPDLDEPVIRAELYASTSADNPWTRLTIYGDGFGLELDSAETDQLIASIETEFLPRLRELRNHLAAIEADGTAPAVEDRTARTCAVHAWCAKSGDHADHLGADVTVIDDRNGDAYLTAHLLQFDGDDVPFIGVEHADLFTAEQARAEAAKFRVFAARLEAMAGQLPSAESNEAVGR